MMKIPRSTTQSKLLVENYDEEKDSFHVTGERRSPGRLAEHRKSYDAVLFEILKISSEDISSQLTLIDLELFQAIKPDEITCCGWNGKKKYDTCPNIVSMIKRFNQVSFWVVSEILAGNTAKNRAAKTSHFIRIAKKLLNLNNLNSLKAVVSGLQNTPVYRLKNTWELVPKRDKEKLKKLNDIVSEDENYTNLRTYVQGIQLPCIPYLGIYLTDMTYIDTIYPNTGGLDTERSTKMNEIIRILAEFQRSNYNLQPINHIYNYLLSVKYIDELQKFMEDESYKLSCKIEPNQRTINEEHNSKSCSPTMNGDLDDNDFISPEKPSSSILRQSPKSLRSISPKKSASLQNRRKAKSLGSNQFFEISENMSKLKRLESEGEELDMRRKSKSVGNDDHFLDTLRCKSSRFHSFSKSSDAISFSIGDEGVFDDLDDSELESCPIIPEPVRQFKSMEPLPPTMSWMQFKLQGHLKRKTCIKNGSRIKISNWQPFWVGITFPGGSLVYFLPKNRTFGAHDRTHFHPGPHKVKSLEGWTVFICSEADFFCLTGEDGKTVYRFSASCPSHNIAWYEALLEATGCEKTNMNQNLINFDEDLTIKDTSL